ncbi:MAG: hypothetical protein QOG49_989, partial [Frankiaceae bacterium]|nr:hypothetical protein [Frankiaceae bacterium]
MRRASAITAVALVGALAAAACSGSKAKSAGPSSAVAPASSSAAAPTVPGSASTAPTGEPVPSSAGTPSAPTSAAAPTPAKSKPAVDPNAPEVVEPGDIPDNQVFIPFTSADGRYVVRVPEGWARTENSGAVTFTDKYNSITIQASPAATAPSVESVKSAGLADVSADPTFALQAVGPVHRKAGDGILATF